MTARPRTQAVLCGLRTLALALLLGAAAAQGAEAWRTHERCRLSPNPANDGDSFHVVASRHHYIFRLYFVDAPETEDSIPERVQEQAAYWKITQEQVMRMGAEAAAFAADTLGASPFTVETRLEDAMGRSHLPRHFALVKAANSETYLDEELVRRGLARVHGVATDFPDGTPARKHWTRLHSIEHAARRQGVGCWGIARRASPVLLTDTRLVLRRPVAAYSVGTPAAYLGILPAETTVRILTVTPGSLLVPVAADAPNIPATVRCRRFDLEVNAR